MAFPASVGLWALLKYCKEPEELIEVGRCAGLDDPGGGEQRSQYIMSISWHDLVSREGADVDTLRQLPLYLLVPSRVRDVHD